MLTTTHSARVNGKTIQYLSVGEGPLVLCLHGFPDTAHSFDAIMPALANSGYRVVAPFQRGIYPSDCAEDGDYSLQALADDISKLIDVFGQRDVVVIGHDWGALIAHVAAVTSPGKIGKLVNLSIPMCYQFKFGWRQLCRSWYILFFQFPGISEYLISLKNYYFLDFLYRIWSPEWDVPQVQKSYVVQSFEIYGAKPALSYYRQIWKIPKDVVNTVLSFPVLTIFGENDGCILPESYVTAKVHSESHAFICLENIGHFPHCEAPDEVLNLIVKFITAD